MSTYYMPSHNINVKQVKKIEGIKVINNKDGDMLFDGKNYLHYSFDKKGNIGGLTRYGTNNPSEMLDKIEFHLGIRFISEHELNHNEDGEEFVCHCCLKPI